jgi:hypothetical protein
MAKEQIPLLCGMTNATKSEGSRKGSVQMAEVCKEDGGETPPEPAAETAALRRSGLRKREWGSRFRSGESPAGRAGLKTGGGFHWLSDTLRSSGDRECLSLIGAL